jgi:hypothetical protein
MAESAAPGCRTPVLSFDKTERGRAPGIRWLWSPFLPRAFPTPQPGGSLGPDRKALGPPGFGSRGRPVRFPNQESADSLPGTEGGQSSSGSPGASHPPPPTRISLPSMPIRVLASVIERDQRLLVCRRPLHKRHGGLWEFPGGKVREGESDLEAVRGVSPGRRGEGGWVG